MPATASVAVRPGCVQASVMRFQIVCLLVFCFLGRCAAQSNPATSPAPSTPAAAVSSIALAPERVILSPGDTQQFSSTVTGPGANDQGVIWSVNGIPGGNAALGTIAKSGLYWTPYPAPSSVIIKATSTFDPTKSATALVTLMARPLAPGPSLHVDAAAATHPISPLIYAMNSYRLSDPRHEADKVAKAVRLPLNRWGGDGVTRYNYKLDISNHGDHWFYENIPNANKQFPDVSEFNTQVIGDRANGTRTMGTVPVIGWVAKSRTRTASFSVAKYGSQQKIDPYWKDFGNGRKPDGTLIAGNDPTDTCMPVDETWAGDWVKFLVSKFGDAAHGGVALYSLDNEPNWWDLNHRDVHPLPFTYDEVTENGIKVAKAVKAADPTAEVSGPVIDNWFTYFYSKKDLASVKGLGSNADSGFPDRRAHGNLPLIPYYLAAFKAAQDANPRHIRLLDYLDLHTYFAAKDAGLKPAGATDRQKAVLDSTRVFWDPAYTDFRMRDPDNFLHVLPPQIIPRMKQWVAENYPGTKTAITEYNWGGQEHISGAVAQADILGIFGREGLDLAALWGPPDLNTPAMFAFKMFRNYDDAGGEFGDTSVSAQSSDQGKLAIYAAQRSADHALTIVVVNKTFGDLQSDISLAHFKAAKRASVFQYSSADLKQIRALPDTTMTQASKKDATYTLKDQVFPAMSITLYAARGR